MHEPCPEHADGERIHGRQDQEQADDQRCGIEARPGAVEAAGHQGGHDRDRQRHGQGQHGQAGLAQKGHLRPTPLQQIVQAIDHPPQFAERLACLPEGAEHGDAVDILAEALGGGGDLAVPGAEQAVQDGRDRAEQQHRTDQQGQQHQPGNPVMGEDHHEQQDARRHAGQDLRQGVGGGVLDPARVLGNQRGQLGLRPALKNAQGHAMQVFDDPRPDRLHGGVTGPEAKGPAGAQCEEPQQHRAEHGQRVGNHVERRGPTVGQAHQTEAHGNRRNRHDQAVEDHHRQPGEEGAAGPAEMRPDQAKRAHGVASAADGEVASPDPAGVAAGGRSKAPSSAARHIRANRPSWAISAS